MENEKNIFKTKRAETPEYSFDAGVDQVLGKVGDILKKQPLAILAFSASGDNVGKTKLSMTLAERLYAQGVYCKTFHDPREVDLPETYEKMAIIFDQMEWDSSDRSSHQVMKKLYDSDAQSAFKENNVDVKGIDLWVGIYRPDKPFYSNASCEKEYLPMADIIIRNEGATDKSRPTAPRVKLKE